LMTYVHMCVSLHSLQTTDSRLGYGTLPSLQPAARYAAAGCRRDLNSSQYASMWHNISRSHCHTCINLCVFVWAATVSLPAAALRQLPVHHRNDWRHRGHPHDKPLGKEYAVSTPPLWWTRSCWWPVLHTRIVGNVSLTSTVPLDFPCNFCFHCAVSSLLLHGCIPTIASE
jgi:hypothetical protein